MNRKGLTAAPANDSASVMGTCARIVGVADRPIQSQKFSGPGLYFMTIYPEPEMRTHMGFWCEQDGQYIRLQRDSKTFAWLSSSAFDAQDVWKLEPVN